MSDPAPSLPPTVILTPQPGNLTLAEIREREDGCVQGRRSFFLASDAALRELWRVLGERFGQG